MWAGTVAHTNICGAGRIQDWASHGIEHELSALYDCAHGAGLAVVMPAWMEYVMNADIPRFARFAAKVFGVADGDANEMAVEGIRRYRAWLKAIDMPTTFAELGAKEEDIPALVAKLGLRGNTLGGFKRLNDEDVANIFRLAVR
jgi:alcohol dehydrogenase YqhD (iron-dependent ADH family)